MRTLTLTDDEKAEARATDPRAAEIIDAVDAMPPEILERLHGAIRSLRPVGADSPAEQPRNGRRGGSRRMRSTPTPIPCWSAPRRS